MSNKHIEQKKQSQDFLALFFVFLLFFVPFFSGWNFEERAKTSPEDGQIQNFF